MIIYSCITDGYDEISDDHYYDPDIKYVMFHDGTIEKKGPWEFIELPKSNLNAVKKSYLPKIQMPFDEPNFWIDGCFTITKKLVEESKKILDQNEYAILRHPNRRTYLEECVEYYTHAYDEYSSLIGITNKLKTLGYKFSFHKSIICGMMWRNPTDKVINHSKIWENIFYSSSLNRDQLVCNPAFYFSGITPKLIRYDQIDHEGRDSKTNRKKEHQKFRSIEMNWNIMMKEISNISNLNSKVYFNSNNLIDRNFSLL
jgi:hypothetical protein